MPLSVTYPYTLVNGTTADASQVMANFNAINTTMALAAPLASPTFTGTVTISGFGTGIVVSNAGGALSTSSLIGSAAQAQDQAINFGGLSAFQMGGIGLTVTPVRSGNVLVLSGGIASSGNPIQLQFRYGTGAPPANQANDTGTPFGSLFSISGSASNTYYLAAIVIGLTLGTPYWFDLAAEGGSTNKNISHAALVVVEI